MPNFNEANAYYLANLEEDPYAKVLLDEIRANLAKIEKRLHQLTPNQEPHAAYYDLGMIKAFKMLLEIPGQARAYINEQPDDKKA